MSFFVGVIQPALERGLFDHRSIKLFTEVLGWEVIIFILGLTS